jgi:ribosomal protein L20
VSLKRLQAQRARGQGKAMTDTCWVYQLCSAKRCQRIIYDKIVTNNIKASHLKEDMKKRWNNEMLISPKQHFRSIATCATPAGITQYRRREEHLYNYSD